MRRPYSLAVLALLAALLMAAGGAGPAFAAPSAVTVAEELQRSSVYIDPAYEEAVPRELQQRLRQAARKAPGNVRVALAPLVKGDQYDGDGREFTTAIRSRLPAGQRDGTFVTANDSYLRSYSWTGGRPDFKAPADDAEYLANFTDGDDGEAGDRSLGERVEVLLTLLREPADVLHRRAEKAKADVNDRARSYRSSGTVARVGGRNGIEIPWWLALIGVLAAGAIGVGVWRRSRRGARAANAPLPVLPDRVFEHARAAQRADLAEDADRELLALATVLDEAPVPATREGQDAYQRALDAYTGARRRMRDGAPTVDLVGVLVLVDHARDDLARAAALDAGRKPANRPALCFFDPLHGRAGRNAAWRDGLRVPACTACAEAVKSGQAPDALRDGDRPYFEADTVWARTGYGTFGDDLVERVARGDR
ncbi:hypothetical protein [Patulibacter americanus]|uniref:hypothetical protein n=1 Tax=Patulibacter americanus TaxID=588672 RepID=UPI0003B59BF7|nr:hypothetical protein [Patulibacter americanus]